MQQKKLWVLGALLTILMIQIGLIMDLNKSEWASWVQAVGSIGAIAGALAVAQRQTNAALRQAQTLRHEDHMGRVRAILPIAAHAHKLIVELAEQPTGMYFEIVYSEAQFKNCLRALQAVPLHELGRYSLVQGYLQLQNALEDAAHDAHEIMRAHIQRNDQQKEANLRSESIEKTRIDADRALELINSAPGR